MERLRVSVLAAVLAVGLVSAAGCGQAAPAPTPTKAPVAATKAAEPTKAPVAPTKAAEPTKAAAPATAVPAKKVDYPEKGKPVVGIVPVAAGGSVDVGARALAVPLEKELGVPVQIVNRPGAATQVGMTEMVRAAPDGHTIAFSALSFTNAYLDPESKAVYGRKDLQVVARTTSGSGAVSVKADSPYKSLKDLLDAAKAKPGEIKMASGGGILGQPHVTIILIEKAAGVSFNVVQFDGGAPALTALLGGHVDTIYNPLSEVVGQAKSGALRILAVSDTNRAGSRFAPGIPTLLSLGYDVSLMFPHVAIARSDVPKERIDILSSAIKRAGENAEFKKKMEDLFLDFPYLGGQEVAAYWDDVDAKSGAVMREFRQQQKK